MTPEQQLVKDWMVKFGQECPNKPTIPSFEIRKLRAKLILEEALETVASLGIDFDINIYGDLVNLRIGIQKDELHYYPDNGCVLSEVMDGVADSLVVQFGCATACGLDAEPFFREVMRSNDSKLWTPDEVEYENKRCVAKDKTIVYFDEHENTYENISPGVTVSNKTRCYLVKDKDGKVMKSPSYSKPELEQFIC